MNRRELFCALIAAGAARALPKPTAPTFMGVPVEWTPHLETFTFGGWLIVFDEPVQMGAGALPRGGWWSRTVGMARRVT